MRFAIEQPLSLGKKTASTVFDETKTFLETEDVEGFTQSVIEFSVSV